MLYKNIWGGMLWDENQTGGESGGDGESSKYTPTSLEDALKVIGALEKRISEREAQRDNHRTRADELEQRMKALEDAQRKSLEETGNHAELARRYAAELEQLKPRATRAEALEAVLRESNEARLGRIPEGMRTLVPTDYPPEKLQTWLNQNEGALSREPAPRLDAGAGGAHESGGVVRLTDEQKRIARGMGITEEEFAAQLKK